MKTKLEELLQRIDPSRNIEEIATRVDDALNSYRMGEGLIRNWDEFKLALIKFCSHVENVVLRISHPNRLHLSPEMYWGRCCSILMKEYGPSGEKAAFEIARTGTEGGFVSILRLFAKRMAEEYAQREISARIGRFYGSLTVDEKLAVCDEYLENYAHLLPLELTEGSAARIKAKFPKVLEEHPRTIQRLRSISRK